MVPSPPPPPAANYPEEVVEGLPASLLSGVYYGWACVGRGEVHKMVMSVGWNPQYQNEKRSMVRPYVYNDTVLGNL